jgi:hypothetical protein
MRMTSRNATVAMLTSLTAVANSINAAQSQTPQGTAQFPHIAQSAQSAQSPQFAQPAQRIAKLPSVSIAVPDVTFDDVASRTLAVERKFNLVLKNVGAAASAPFEVQCNYVVAHLPPASAVYKLPRARTLAIPAIAIGARYTTQNTEDDISGAAFIARSAIKCVADAQSKSGELRKTNNTFEYDPASTSAPSPAADLTRLNTALAASAGTVGATIYIGAPDLAFDTATMTTDADRSGGASGGNGSSGSSGATGYRTPVGYRIAVHNAGDRASKATTVVCTDTTDFTNTTPGANQGSVSRRTWSWTRAVPVVAPGAHYKDQVEVFGNDDLIQRSCVIDGQSVSGDTNKRNNVFEFRKGNQFTAPFKPKT